MKDPRIGGVISGAISGAAARLSRRQAIGAGAGAAMTLLLCSEAKAAGSRLPVFELPLLNGSRFVLGDALGKVAVVNFWASWCAPCLAEMPVLDRLARARRDIAMVGASCDERRDIGKVKAMAARLAYPVGMLVMGGINSFGTPRQVPETIVLRPDGRVSARFGAGFAEFSEAELLRAVAAAMRGAEPNRGSV